VSDPGGRRVVEWVAREDRRAYSAYVDGAFAGLAVHERDGGHEVEPWGDGGVRRVPAAPWWGAYAYGERLPRAYDSAEEAKDAVERALRDAC
jgi:hypothetical protein